MVKNKGHFIHPLPEIARQNAEGRNMCWKPFFSALGNALLRSHRTKGKKMQNFIPALAFQLKKQTRFRGVWWKRTRYSHRHSRGALGNVHFWLHLPFHESGFHAVVRQHGWDRSQQEGKSGKENQDLDTWQRLKRKKKKKKTRVTYGGKIFSEFPLCSWATEEKYH